MAESKERIEYAWYARLFESLCFYAVSGFVIFLLLKITVMLAAILWLLR